MDAAEASKVVLDKILELEPEHVAKTVMGYIIFQGISREDWIRLACGPESSIHNLIHHAKTARLMTPAPFFSHPPMSPPTSDHSGNFSLFSSSPTVFRSVGHQWDPQHHQQIQNSRFKIMPCSNNYMGMEDRMDVVSAAAMKPVPSGFSNDYYCPEAAAVFSMRGRGISPVNTCHISNGFCKHGSNCRFFHGESFPEKYPHAYGRAPYDIVGEAQVFSPGSLDKLELEIVELLKSRRGNPVSIASLPMLYYDKYGKTLQAEGYLTESQRHGRAGFSLTKLLARLDNSIRLIDRPHGQHAVILAEDDASYIERNETAGHTVNSSRQIYLTFPAESTFTEEDVSNYFSTFGPVQDVRIPCQQKRMFGFVSFESADTVKLILTHRNPHDICGASVLVKPYRKKPKLVERKFDHHVRHNSHAMDIDSELPAKWASMQLFRRQLREEQEQALEFERMRLSKFQIACNPVWSQSCLGHSMDELKHPQDDMSYLLGVLNSDSITGTDDDHKIAVNKCAADQESSSSSSQELNLPESPFAAATVI